MRSDRYNRIPDKHTGPHSATEIAEPVVGAPRPNSSVETSGRRVHGASQLAPEPLSDLTIKPDGEAAMIVRYLGGCRESIRYARNLLP